MNAQEIIEKIRAEIERLKHTDIPHTDEWWDGADYVRRRMKEVLSDLEKSEKPTTADGLEDILLEFYDEYDSNVANRPIIPRLYAEKLARHFYELGRKSKGAEWTEKDIENGSYISAFLQANCGNNVILKEATMWFMSRLRQLPIQQSKVQPVCEDLKKRVSEIYPNKEGDLYSLHSTLQRGGYIRGYQDCKDEMMKKAVEGEIINAGYPTKIELNTFYSKFEHGQKVKLIIIKED